MQRKKHLRSGYTTGACAAAAAKAAAILLLRATGQQNRRGALKDGCADVEIPFPDGSRHTFRLKSMGYRHDNDTAFASVIKDAGDDPDITNGAEIIAEAKVVGQKDRRAEGQRAKNKNTEALLLCYTNGLTIKGGKGVGIVTRPGLAIAVGEPAINPVPRRMITEAVMEAIKESVEAQKRKNSEVSNFNIEITISVTNGEELAKKTLNPRLGIVGGISILGTTGIVRPLSTEAWTASISSAMDVAKAMGNAVIVLSAGRQSEKAHTKRFNLPEEAYVMMGDYLEFSLRDASKHGFEKIHLCAQWAKMLKIAMSTPQTHVRHGALDTKKAVSLLNRLGVDIPRDLQFNTAREIFDFIQSTNQQFAFTKVCFMAKKYAEEITSAIPVTTHLVSYEGEIITNSG